MHRSELWRSPFCLTFIPLIYSPIHCLNHFPNQDLGKPRNALLLCTTSIIISTVLLLLAEFQDFSVRQGIFLWYFTRCCLQRCELPQRMYRLVSQLYYTLGRPFFPDATLLQSQVQMRKIKLYYEGIHTSHFSDKFEQSGSSKLLDHPR